MAYTTINKSSDFFNTKLYTGNGSTNAITGVGFQPDWTWLKSRSQAVNHYVFDAVRGVTKGITTNTTSAESTKDSSWVTSFDSDGFSLGSEANINTSSATYASWNWKAGTSFTNDASATGIGTIDSTGSVNQDAGFSIISYTGTGSVGTVAHNLGAKPNVMIQKKLSGSGAWIVYHDKVATNPSHKYLYLNSTATVGDYTPHFNDTEPTSSVFTLGTDTSINGSSATNIMYCFAEKQGYSKFGSYLANAQTGINGPFIYLGFKPSLVIIKNTAATGWYMYDNKRNPYNRVAKALFPDSNAAEYDYTDRLDFLSNGFAIRGASASTGDNSPAGQEYIYMAFAEAPLVGTNNVPCTAR